MSDRDRVDVSELPSSGAYRLTVRVSKAVRVRAGRLGIVSLPAGIYVYCGSARRGLPARVARHLRRRKRRHWHIDYLLARREARVIAVAAWTDRTECNLSAEAIADGGRIIAPGFGSTDCRRGCGAHLVWISAGEPGCGSKGNACPPDSSGLFACPAPRGPGSRTK